MKFFKKETDNLIEILNQQLWLNILIKKIVHRMVATRWTQPTEWMLDIILFIFY